MIPDRKRAQALLTRRGRRAYRQFLVEGVRLVEEVVSAGLHIRRIYHLPAEPDTRRARLLADAHSRGIPLAELTPDELASLSDTASPQGVIAVADIPGSSVDDVWSGGEGDVLILDNVRDPGNVGTLLRTAEAAGARGAIATPGTVELANPKVVRACMGAFFRLPTGVASSQDEIVRRCREEALPVAVMSAHDGEPVSVLRQMGACGLVLGGEAEGADRTWEALADVKVRIPMQGATESLNVSVVGGIVLFRHVWPS